MRLQINPPQPPRNDARRRERQSRHAAIPGVCPHYDWQSADKANGLENLHHKCPLSRILKHATSNRTGNSFGLI